MIVSLALTVSTALPATKSLTKGSLTRLLPDAFRLLGTLMLEIQLVCHALPSARHASILRTALAARRGTT